MAALIEQADGMDKSEILAMGDRAKKRITDAYSWDEIVRKYERLFSGMK